MGLREADQLPRIQGVKILHADKISSDSLSDSLTRSRTIIKYKCNFS